MTDMISIMTRRDLLEGVHVCSFTRENQFDYVRQNRDALMSWFSEVGYDLVETSDQSGFYLVVNRDVSDFQEDVERSLTDEDLDKIARIVDLFDMIGYAMSTGAILKKHVFEQAIDENESARRKATDVISASAATNRDTITKSLFSDMTRAQYLFLRKNGDYQVTSKMGYVIDVISSRGVEA